MNFSHRPLIDRYLLAAACSIAIATMLVTPLRAQTQTELETEKTLVWKMLHQGDFAKARSLLSSLCDTARDSKESGLGQKSVFYLECLSLLGAIELRSGMLTEASGHLTEAKDGFARKRRSFKDDYRQAMVRGQLPAFMAYAGQITGHYCRDLDCLGEVKLEQQAFEEADSLFKESLKAREASIADGIAPNEPVPSGLTMSKHLQGLYCLRKGDLTHARHYLEAAVKEFEAFIAAKAEAAAEAASEQAEAAEPQPPANDVAQQIVTIDQTLSHVALLTHLGELESAEGNFTAAAQLAQKAGDLGRSGLGEKHGVLLEPTLLLVKTRSSEADQRLAANEPREARAAIQAAMLEYAKAEPVIRAFWVPTYARRLQAEELGGSLRQKAAAVGTAVASLDDAEKAADVAMTKAGEGDPPKKTTTKRRIIRRVVPKKPVSEDGTPATPPAAAPTPVPATPTAAE